MQLTTIPDHVLPDALATVASYLAPESRTAKVLARIAATRDLIALGVDTPSHRDAAVDLARAFGIGVIDEEPQAAFSYDGHAIRTRSEAYVLIHEVAHWLVAPPAEPIAVTVKLRAREAPRPGVARWDAAAGRLLVRLEEPNIAAPGQACVLYAGERVLGGGFLRAA